MKIKHSHTDIPVSMRSLSITSKGYLKPWFVEDDDFRIVDTRKAIISISKKACWICGKEFTNDKFALVGSIKNSSDLIFREPPCHVECAIYAMQVCPFILHPSAKFRTAGLSPERLHEFVNRNLDIKYADSNPGSWFITIVRDCWLHKKSKTIRCSELDVLERQHWQEGRLLTQFQQRLPKENHVENKLSNVDIDKNLHNQIQGLKDKQPFSYLALDFYNFQDLYWNKPKQYLFARQDSLIAIGLNEVEDASKSLPLVFVRQGSNFILAALTSINSRTNTLVNDDGDWTNPYLPACYENYPFRYSVDEENVPRLTCSISEIHGAISNRNNENADSNCRFYSNDGTLTTKVRQAWQNLETLYCEQNRARKLGQILNDLGLLKECEISIFRSHEQKVVKLKDIFKVESQSLNSFEDGKIAEVLGISGKQIAKYLIASLKNVDKLLD